MAVRETWHEHGGLMLVVCRATTTYSSCNRGHRQARFGLHMVGRPIHPIAGLTLHGEGQLVGSLWWDGGDTGGVPVLCLNHNSVVVLCTSLLV